MFFTSPVRTSCCYALMLFPLAAMAEELSVVTGVSTPSLVLNKNQISNVFLGKATTFPDGSKAIPVDQAESSPLRDEFYAKLTNLSAAQAKAQWAKLHFTGRGVPPRECRSDDELKRMLNATPGSISYIDRAAVDASLRVVFTPE